MLLVEFSSWRCLLCDISYKLKLIFVNSFFHSVIFYHLLLSFTAINFYFVPSGNRHFRNNQVAQWPGLGVLFSESVENKKKYFSSTSKSKYARQKNATWWANNSYKYIMRNNNSMNIWILHDPKILGTHFNWHELNCHAAWLLYSYDVRQRHHYMLRLFPDVLAKFTRWVL